MIAPAGKCLVCTKNDTIGSALYACMDCLNHVLRLLRELEDYLTHQLPAMKEPMRGQTGRLSPGYGSRSPARDDVLSALDPRSLPGDVDEDGEPITRRPDDTGTWVRSITGGLEGIAAWIAEHRGWHPPFAYDHDVTDQPIAYIRRHLYWSGGQPWIDDIADDIAELHDQARRLANDGPQQPIASCLTVTCDGQVYEGDYKKPARCAKCKRPYEGLDLIRLGVAEGTAA